MDMFQDLASLRRPSTAPLPSHLPNEQRGYSPDFMFMPPLPSDDLSLNNTHEPEYTMDHPDYHAFRFARRPSKDSMQTHFALENPQHLGEASHPLHPRYFPPPSLASLPVSEEAPLRATNNKKASPAIKVLRPPNAWILYRSDKLAEAKTSQGPRTPQAELSKHIAESWKCEPPETKRKYERQAELRKLEHEAQHPGYKFQPKKRGKRDVVPKTKPLTRKRAGTTSSATNSTADILCSAQSTPLGSRDVSPTEAHSNGVYAPDAPYTSAWPSSMPATTVSPSGAPSLDEWQLNALPTPQSAPIQMGAAAASFSGGCRSPETNRPLTASGLHTADLHTSAGPVCFDQPPIQSAPPTALQTPELYQKPTSASSAFLPPPADYTFPAAQPTASQAMNSMQCSRPYSSYTSPYLMDPACCNNESPSGSPAWWPFRDVKVVRDEHRGVPLQQFLEDMSEAEGQTRARAVLESSFTPLDPRPGSSSSRLNTATFSHHQEVMFRPSSSHAGQAALPVDMMSRTLLAGE